MDKENVVYTYNDVNLALKKEGNPVICNNPDEPWEHNALWNKINKANTVWLHLWECIYRSQNHGNKVEWSFPGAKGSGNGSCSMEVLVLQDEKFLEICYTTMWIQLTLLNCRI